MGRTTTEALRSGTKTRKHSCFLTVDVSRSYSYKFTRMGLRSKKMLEEEEVVPAAGENAALALRFLSGSCGIAVSVVGIAADGHRWRATSERRAHR